MTTPEQQQLTPQPIASTAEKQLVGAAPASALAGRAAMDVSLAPQTLQQAMVLASQLAKSSLIPRALQGNPQDVLIIILTAQELGIGTMTALRSVYVWDGKPTLAAQLAVGIVQRRREICEYFRLVESTDQKAVYETKRVGNSVPSRLEWTIKDAERAGLLGKDTWKKYPAAMLRNRCMMDLARSVYQDLMNNVYDPDELPEGAAHWAQRVEPVPSGPVVTREEMDPATGELIDVPVGDSLAATVARDVETAEARIRGAATKDEAYKVLRSVPPPIQKRLAPLYREQWGAK